MLSEAGGKKCHSRKFCSVLIFAFLFHLVLSQLNDAFLHLIKIDPFTQSMTQWLMAYKTIFNNIIKSNVLPALLFIYFFRPHLWFSGITPSSMFKTHSWGNIWSEDLTQISHVQSKIPLCTLFFYGHSPTPFNPDRFAHKINHPKTTTKNIICEEWII